MGQGVNIVTSRENNSIDSTVLKDFKALDEKIEEQSSMKNHSIEVILKNQPEIKLPFKPVKKEYVKYKWVSE